MDRKPFSWHDQRTSRQHPCDTDPVLRALVPFIHPPVKLHGTVLNISFQKQWESQLIFCRGVTPPVKIGYDGSVRA